MLIKKYSLITTLFLILSNALFGQMTVKFPTERAVFQRNTSNIGFINITGNLTKDADLVEARLVTRVNGQGTNTDWTTIDNSIDGMAFTGRLQGSGGWYSLEIRSKLFDNITETYTVSRVGIGEVFYIAGQSNASGTNIGNNPNGANDDRVNAVSSIEINNNSIPNFQFSQLTAYFNIAPSGVTAWCYGDLGDMLTQRLNVPILFINAAWSGTSSTNWYKSMLGQYTSALYQNLPPNQPYQNLKNSLQNSIKLLGGRAILWHQGEFDFDVSQSTYFNNLKGVIQGSRNDTGVNLPWVVARASSYSNINVQSTIDAQNQVINSVENVFAGPETDNIQTPRLDGAHFYNTASEKGLTELAQAWNNSLNDTFFANAVSTASSSLNEIKYNCISSSNQRNVSIDVNYPSYQWSNGANTNLASFSSGSIENIARNQNGVVIYSNTLKYYDTEIRPAPSIYASNSIKACVDKTVSIKNDRSKYQLIWSNGTVADSIKVASPAADYTAYYKNSLGCVSASSNIISPVFVDHPAKPSFAITNGDGVVCDGQIVNVTVNNPNNFDVKWNIGDTKPSISLTKNLTNPVNVTLYSNFDCPSPVSDSVKYHFVNIPKTPSLIQDGPYSMKATVDSLPTSFIWSLDNLVIQNETKIALALKTNGLYDVKSVNSFTSPVNRVQNCISPSSTKLQYIENTNWAGIAVYPNPIVDSKINISSNRNLNAITYKVYNNLGQVLQEGKFDSITAFPSTISLSNSNNITDKVYLRIEYNGALYRTYPLILAQ